jgi:hypothetical protein
MKHKQTTLFSNYDKLNLHNLIQNLHTMCGTNGTNITNGTDSANAISNDTRNGTLPSSNVCVRQKSRWIKVLIRIL